MSEYQSIAFRAIDGPVSEKTLSLCGGNPHVPRLRRGPSTMNTITATFTETRPKCRRGYDMHLHYANFGVRNL